MLGSARTVNQSTYTCPYQHGDPRVTGVLGWQLKALRAGVSMIQVEYAWPFMTKHQEGYTIISSLLY